MSSMFDEIIRWDNLWEAFRKAARGKRGKRSAATFEHQVTDRLADLQSDLAAGAYRPGPYRSFHIHEPKRRKISAAPFRDRVAHHALCNVIEPMFERRFILDSYANRAGKGTHAAVDRLQHLMRRHHYALKCDIAQHFPSLDHAVLRGELFGVITDERTRRLIDVILASGEGVLREEYTPVLFPGDDLFAVLRPRGLPIGNLTSQFWSNVYMNPLDWFVTRELGCRAYLRYVDDFVLLSDSPGQLREWRAAIIERLARLRLTLHERESQAAPVTCGVPWLGFVVFPTHRRVKRRNVLQFGRRLARNIDLYRAGEISFAELDASVKGWVNHVRYADTWGLREQLLGAHPI